MPPFDPQVDEALIRALYPRDTGTVLDLRLDNRALACAEELVVTREGMRRLTATEKRLRTELAGKLGAHTYGLLSDGRCLSFKTQHRKAYSVAASDSRTLRVLNARPQDLKTDDEE
jgi:hypothetical protein